MGILWPHSNTTARTNADRRAAGALAYFFEAGTTTPRATYQDANLTTPHAHPVVADAYGRFPAVFIDFGSYRERIKTAGNTQLWDTDDVPNPAPTDPGEGVPEVSLLQPGDVFFGFRNDTRLGAVRANGDTIGSANSGAGERANDDTLALYTELYLSLSDAVCPVIGGRSGDAAADFAADKRLTLPDLRGACPFGLDDMGNTEALRFNAAVPFLTGTAIIAGSTAGANHHTLALSQTPSHLHSVSITSQPEGHHDHTFSGGSAASSGSAHQHSGTTNGPSADHTHQIPAPTGTTVQAGGVPINIFSVSVTNSSAASVSHNHSFTSDLDGAHTHTVSGTISHQNDHAHLVSGDTGSQGGGGAHNNLPRAVLGTWYIKL